MPTSVVPARTRSGPTNVVLVLGAPGAGKGTVCNHFTSTRRRLHLEGGWRNLKGGWAHVESGRRFRQVIAEAPDSPIAKYVSNGTLVPDEIVIEQASSWIQEHSGADGLLLDGLPRTPRQCLMLDELLGELGLPPVSRAIYISVTMQDLLARLEAREICPNIECRSIFNRVTKPAKSPGFCDRCRSKLEARADDASPEVVARRLEIFQQLYPPVIDYYRERGLLSEVRYNNDMTVSQLLANVEAAL
jgi:adenylate kinase